MSDTPEPDMPEPDEPDTPDDTPEAGQQAVTASTKDYMGRALNNPVPGTSTARDHLYRDVRAGGLDYLSHALVA